MSADASGFPRCVTDQLRIGRQLSSGKIRILQEGGGMWRRLGGLLWESWCIAKDFYEHHHFASWLLLAVPSAVAGFWAWLANFNALAIFIILLGVAALFTIIVFSGVVAFRLMHDPDKEVSANGIAQGYLTCRQVIEYLAHQSQWGADKDTEVTPDGMHKNVLLEAPGEFRDRASEGRIRVYGISPVTHEHEEIPAVHWLSFGFEYTAMFREDGECRTEQKGAVGGYYNKPGYSGLRIAAGDVYKTWPKRRCA